MSILSGSLRLLRSAVKTQLIPKATISCKPAKHPVSTMDQAIAMTVMFATVLGPSGWILVHLEDYKKKA